MIFLDKKCKWENGKKFTLRIKDKAKDYFRTVGEKVVSYRQLCFYLFQKKFGGDCDSYKSQPPPLWTIYFPTPPIKSEYEMLFFDCRKLLVLLYRLQYKQYNTIFPIHLLKIVTYSYNITLSMLYSLVGNCETR